MSLEAQYRALYRLMYKSSTLDAYLQGKFKQFPDLDDAENEQIKVAMDSRFNVVVGLHANDIGNNWYMPRFPASWIALQVALECNQAELTLRYTDSDAFETRINDDNDGSALAAFAAESAESGNLNNAPWLPELLRYERMVRGYWPDETNPRVEKFDWDVGGVLDALLDKELFPVDEKQTPLHMLLYRDQAGVSEITLSAEQARVMQKVLSRDDTSNEPPKIVAKCRRVLNQLKG